MAAARRDATANVPGDGHGRAVPSRSRGIAGARVTIAMVAEEAGVSVPTVSKVLNGRHHVGADTRRRVQQVLDRTEAASGAAAPARIAQRGAHRPRQLRDQHRGHALGARAAHRGRAGGLPARGKSGAERHPRQPGTPTGLDGHADLTADRRRGLRHLARPPARGRTAEPGRHPPGGHRPDGRPRPQRTDHRGLQLRRGILRHRAPGRPRARRIGVVTGPDDVQCSRERLDGYRQLWPGQASTTTPNWSAPATSSPRAAGAPPPNCSTSTTRPPPSSPSPTCRPAVSTTRRTSGGCESRGISAWWASTMWTPVCG